ncbi:MAG: MEDS domain-containing protein [Kiritimatiellae bacterium]|nr:MEDS domain-containing protein [Kiritimatiellia bacterium]
MSLREGGQAVASLHTGDHVCWLFHTQEEHRAVLRTFIESGIERNERVLYITESDSTENLCRYLRSFIADCDVYLQRRQLVVCTSRDAFLRDGYFVPERMLILLDAERNRALKEGYAGLRVTGEMVWALRDVPGADRLTEYASKASLFVRGRECVTLWQYPTDTFESDALLDLLTAHPVVMLGTDVIRDNLYYVPREDLQEDTEPVQVPARVYTQRMLSLARYQRLARELGQTRDALTRTEEELARKTAGLRELLQQVNGQRERIETEVERNVRNLLLPLLEKIKASHASEDRMYAELLEATLTALSSSSHRHLAEQIEKLTAREIEVCSLIHNGLTTKEVARVLNISLQTAETHRKKIRKKLGISKKSVNLAAYLKKL